MKLDEGMQWSQDLEMRRTGLTERPGYQIGLGGTALGSGCVLVEGSGLGLGGYWGVEPTRGTRT